MFNYHIWFSRGIHFSSQNETYVAMRRRSPARAFGVRRILVDGDAFRPTDNRFR